MGEDDHVVEGGLKFMDKDLGFWGYDVLGVCRLTILEFRSTGLLSLATYTAIMRFGLVEVYLG